MSHDLGHTPFGHQGERTLDDILVGKIEVGIEIPKELLQDRIFGSFKHNYQSAKLLTKLEEKYVYFSGLDVSIQVVEGALKYTRLKNEINVHDFLDDEYIKYINLIDKGGKCVCATLEGQSVALADEIAQRGHDVDDALTSGVMSIEELIGIGILSCFMLGDAIEITTKHYENAYITLSFVIEGVNERFYHIPTNELDSERIIGEHGTLVKIILNEKTSKTINCNIAKDLHYFIFAGNKSIYDETFDKASYKEFENSLFWKVNKQIGIPAPNIEVCVYDEKYKPHPIIPFNDIFDFRKYPNTNVAAFAAVWERYHFRNGIENPYKDVIP